MRLVVRCERPQGGRDEGLAWLRTQLLRVALDPDVRTITLTELEAAGAASVDLPLLVECELVQGCDPDRVAARAAFADLLSELRSLRLSPAVALAPEPAGVIDASRRT